MRTSTKNIVTSIGLGTIAMSYVIGMNSATASNGFSASGIDSGASPTSSASASSSATPSSATEATSTPAPTSASTPAASTTKKKSSSSSSSSAGSSSGASVTKSGEAISYQFGVVQISVTKVGSKITDVTLLQSGATHGREAAFSPLVQAAINAQGSNFGNLTGATYTTDAFKQALDSALSKF